MPAAVAVGGIHIVPMALPITQPAHLAHGPCPLGPCPYPPCLGQLGLMMRVLPPTGSPVALFTVSCGSATPPAEKAEKPPAPPAWSVKVDPVDVPAGPRRVERALKASPHRRR